MGGGAPRSSSLGGEPYAFPGRDRNIRSLAHRRRFQEGIPFRLKEDVSPAQAAAALTPPLADLRREFPKMIGANERAHLVPLRQYLKDYAGSAPLLLFGAVGLVLLLACANVANLTLTRSASRRKEIAIRAAIGAGRRRVVRQLLTESILLALFGGFLGLLVCYSTFNFVLSLVPPNLPHVGAIELNWNVLLFALALSMVTGAFFGLAPALSASRADLGASLKESAPHSGLEGHPRLRSGLAIAEISVSLVLLTGSALAIESFITLVRVRPGFDPKNLLTFNVSFKPRDKGTIAGRVQFYEHALASIRALPDVENVTLVNVLPFYDWGNVGVTIEGGSTPASEADLGVFIRVVSPEYFPTMRIPLLRGRGFSQSDDAGSQPVVIINQTMAKRCCPNRDPIGQRIWIGKPMGPEWTEPSPRLIVGVVGDIYESGPASAPGPMIYVPHAQKPDVEAYFLVRTRHNPMAAAPEIRKTLAQVDPNLPLAQLRTMDEVLSASLIAWRFRTILLTLFGALAVFIAAIGIYGVISNSVAQRTHEIGVRMALGARREDVLKLVVHQGLRLTLIGVVVGIFVALALTRFLASFLYGVKPTDTLTFVSVSVVLTAVAMVASYLPARRATKVDPMVALRCE